MKVSIGDTSLWFDVDGAKLVAAGDAMVERKTIVLLHGGPGFDHSIYKPTVQSLAEHYQLAFLDQRGQGRSDAADPASWNLNQWADDVAAFCKTLQIEKPILLGHSFGGFVALAAAARHPELASGLVILAAAAHVEREASIARFGQRGGADAAAAARHLFDRPSDDEALGRFAKHCFPLYSKAGFDPAIFARAIYKQEFTNHFFEPKGEYGNFDYRPQLAGCRVPTLMLHGDLDPIVPIEFARTTAAAFPPGVAELVIYEGASHDLVRDRWDDASAAITAFVDAL